MGFFLTSNTIFPYFQVAEQKETAVTTESIKSIDSILKGLTFVDTPLTFSGKYEYMVDSKHNTIIVFDVAISIQHAKSFVF